MTTLANKKLAVLIDADNAPADIIDRLLEEVAKYGIASVKRIYGDWSHGLSKWKAALLPHAIIPVQQFAYTKGKNATDMALVIDAMDLLYSGNFDGFCIVSSDSDFTRLASRLRESGLTVYGFGEKKTPEAFRKACDKFIYTEIFRPEKQRQEKEKNSGKNTPAAAPDALSLLKRAVRENADDLGWANLGPIGSYISKINPDFDSRLYGYGKLSDLIKSFDIFEHRTDNNQLQVRRRKSADKPTCKPPPPFALCYINFCTRSVLKVTAAFALYRMAEDNKSDVSVAFVLPVANNQRSQCRHPLLGWRSGVAALLRRRPT